MGDYTRWYRVGTAALTKNSKIVTGTGTYWLAAGLHPGDIFSTDGVTDYEVQSIDSNTQLTLKTPYSGDTTSETEYSIVRNFTASMAAETAANATALLNDFRQFVDLKMQSIHGKSAYQIACEKGYTGTESEWIASLEGDDAYHVAVANGYEGTAEEWLESLKAAGEWAKASADITALTTNTAYANDEKMNILSRNSFYRGKGLGVFTEAHYTALKSKGGRGLFVGDYFDFPLADGTRDPNFMHWSNCWYIVGFAPGNRMFLMAWNALMGSFWEEHNVTVGFNAAARGTEGEEGYVPATTGSLYPTSNWYVNMRPVLIEWAEENFLGHLVGFSITVPSSFDGSTGTVTSVVNLTSKAHLPTMSMLTGIPHLGIMDWMRNAGNSYRQTFHYEMFPLQRFNQPFNHTSGIAQGAAGAAEQINAYMSITPTANSIMLQGPGLRPIICIG